MKRFITTIVIVLLCGCIISCNKKADEDIDYSLNLNTKYEINDTLVDGNHQKAKVIVLLGQSNASGCSIVEYLELNVSKDKFNYYEQGFNNILINYCIDDHSFTSNGGFKPVDLTCGCGNGFFGPEVGMAESLSNEFKDEHIFILKYTMSGYSLANHWLRNYERSDIYQACLIYLETYLDYLISKNYQINLDAICWMQGESDTASKNAKKYYDNERLFIEYLRADLAKYNDDEIYFIDAGISSSPYCEPGYPEVNLAKQKIRELSPYNRYFSTIENGLTTLYEPDYDPDLGHYDSLSEIKLGHLFGEYIISIYQSK